MVDPTPADGAAQEPADAASRSRRAPLLWAVGVLAVLALVGGVLLATTGEETAPGDVTVTCQPTPGQTQGATTGLQPEPGPDAIPPATLCAFADDSAVDLVALLDRRPAIVNFWATWCAPCVAEMPEFEELHDLAGDELLLVGINTQDAPPLARDFATDLGISYPLLRDPDGAYFAAIAGFGMPTTLFVTPEGRIAFRQTGPLTLDQMADLASEHLGVTVDTGA